MTTPDWRRLLDHVMACPEQIYEHWNGTDGWDNDTVFGKEYGENFVSWCVIWEWDMFHDVGLDAVVPKTDNVTSFTNWAKARGLWSEYPSVGSWTNFSNGAHTEMVIGFDAVNVRTKGGNSVPAGSTDAGQGNGVWSHTTPRTSPRILGYFTPRFPDSVCPPTADPHDPRGGPAVTSYTWTGPVVISGVDVSDFQSAAFPTAGLDFAFIKITEGTGYVNPKWTQQRQTARQAGLVRGFYHFGRPGDMHAQVDYFLSKIILESGDILAFDWEDTGISSAQKDDWLKYAKGKAPGHKVVLYCNRDFWLNRDISSYAGDGLWIADYVTAGSPRVQAPWVFHQYTDSPLDKDAGNFTSRDALKTWAGTPEDDMPLTAADAKLVAAAVWDYALQSPTTLAWHSAQTFLRYVDKNFADLSDAEKAGALQLVALLNKADAMSSQAKSNGTGVSELKIKADVVSDQAAALKVTLDDLTAKAVALEELLSAPGALIEKFTEALNALKINITTTAPEA